MKEPFYWGHVEVREVPGKGLGLFSVRKIYSVMRVAVTPIVLLDVPLFNHGKISDYEFQWDEEHVCLALGPVSFANHSSNPNCSVVRDFEEKTIGLRPLRSIEPNEELTFHYDCELWFKEMP
jgi:hypothetical protein